MKKKDIQKLPSDFLEEMVRYVGIDIQNFKLNGPQRFLIKKLGADEAKNQHEKLIKYTEQRKIMFSSELRRRTRKSPFKK